jgi:murein L,D-transpeptidase YcbB/YkuD
MSHSCAFAQPPEIGDEVEKPSLPILHFEEMMMKPLFIALSALALTFGSAAALADDTTLINDMNMKPLTAAQSAQFKTERDAAKAKWATMTPAEKAAATQSMKSKKNAEMNYVDKFAQNDDMTAMTKSETAQMKAERETAEASYAKLTAEQKAALRKSAQQKRLSELDAMERVGQNDDMSRYLSY